jgi:opacity protein-like surface antigen
MFSIFAGNVMKKILAQLLLLLLFGTSAIPAEDFKRFEFQPFGGYSASGDIPLITDDNVDHGSIRVNNSYNVGGTFAVNLNTLDAVEAFWQRQFTEGRLPAEIAVPQSPGDLIAFDLKIDQIHCNFLHHYRIFDPRAKPYIMAGLGATTYYANRNGQSDSQTQFSFAFGGGMKYFLTNHFGLRGEARWSPAVIMASDSSFWCSIGGSGANCAANLKIVLQNQLDLTGGLVFRF